MCLHIITYWRNLNLRIRSFLLLSFSHKLKSGSLQLNYLYFLIGEFIELKEIQTF